MQSLICDCKLLVANEIKKNTSEINIRSMFYLTQYILHLIIPTNVVVVVLVLVQLLSCVWFFATPWTVAHQVPLSSAISWSLLKFTSTESVALSKHLILCGPLLHLPSIFPNKWSLKKVMKSIKIIFHFFVLKSSKLSVCLILPAHLNSEYPHFKHLIATSGLWLTLLARTYLGPGDSTRNESQILPWRSLQKWWSGQGSDK